MNAKLSRGLQRMVRENAALRLRVAELERALGVEPGEAISPAAGEPETRDRSGALSIRSESLLTRVLESLPVGVWITDAQGAITKVNEAGRRIWAGARYVGPEHYGEYRGWWADSGRLIAPDEWAAARAVTKGETSLDEEIDIECFDGTRKTILNSAIPMFDSARRVVGAVIVNVDITERKRAISEKRESDAERERLMAAIEQAGEIVCITNPEGSIEYVNAAFEVVTGYSRAEALGRNPNMLQSGKTSATVYDELWSTIRGGRLWRGRLENRRKDGTPFTQDITITPITNTTGQIVSYVAVMRDITEQLQLSEQLLASQKLEAVGGLAGGIAHDFNNLLAVILGCARLVISSHPDNEELQEDLGEIVSAGERAAILTRQLLAFSRKQVLAPKVIDLNRIVEGLMSMLGRLIGEDIQLESRLAADLGRVRADPGQLEQVIMNLAVNARDAMPHGGHLVIETSNVELDETFAARHVSVSPGRYLMLAIADTGSGMDEATQRRMFEPFFTTKPVGQGTGLGLSTVYGIVKQSGGSIWVHSELGKGTKISLFLPRLDGDYPVEELERETRQTQAGTETILLVEDDDAVRSTTRRILGAAGYRVLSAPNGNVAMTIWDEHPGAIDLLLTDVVMPQLSGVQLAKMLRVREPRLPVIFMSGYTDGAIVSDATLDTGALFIAKPFSAVNLTQKIREIIDSTAALRSPGSPGHLALGRLTRDG